MLNIVLSSELVLAFVLASQVELQVYFKMAVSALELALIPPGQRLAA
jgi:hypothetical protein